MREHRPLLLLLAVQLCFSLLVWFSGSMYGSWAIECGVGSIGHDLARGLNPRVPLPDYYDGWTSGYLLAGILGAPLHWLPVRSIYALKALCVLLDVAIATVAWLFLRRNVGPRAARVGTALLVLCPPQLAFYALHAGDYHYTELLFDLGMAALLAEVAIHGRRGVGWYAALGLVCGLAVTNCLGSLPFVAVVGVLWWILDKGSLARPQFWAAPVAGLLGLAPVLHKLFVHIPYGLGRGPVGAKIFYVRGAGPGSPSLLEKLADLPAAYTSTLGFSDGLRPLMSWPASWSLGATYALLTALGLVAVLALRWRPAWGLVRALLPGARFAPDAASRRAAGELILAGFTLAFVLAYLLSDQLLVADHPLRSQLRSNRFVPPIIALLAINGGVAVQLLTDRWPAARRWAAWLWAPLAALCLLSWGGMVDWGGLATSRGIPFRGHCYDLHGFYASSFLPDVEGPGGGEDRWASVDICAGFEPAGRADCFLGRTWGVGRRYVPEREMAVTPPERWRPDPRLARACDALPGGWRDDCYRQVGWTINWGILKGGHGPPWALLPGYCAAMPTPEAADLCVEGGGFYLGDHYAFAPWKFNQLVPPDRATPRVRQRFAAGVGASLTHYLEHTERALEVCEQYGAVDPQLAEPCREGVRAGVEARARPFPPWEGWPEPVPIRWSPEEVTVGHRVDLTLELQPPGGVEPGATVFVGFPHPYHAARNQQPGDPYPPRLAGVNATDATGPLPARVRDEKMGHQYAEVTLARGLKPGEALRVVLPGWPTPHYAAERFEPRVLLRRSKEQAPRRIPGATAVRVRPGEPVALVAVASPLARPGESIELGVRLVDGWGNPVGAQPDTVVVDGVDRALQRGRLVLPPRPPGLHRLAVEAGGLVAASVPVLVEPGERRLVWADLHGHSALSDGAGTPTAYYAWARDVAALDAAALSDHDWQLTDAEVDALADAAQAATEPGRFVALPAAETNIVGHEVAWFADVERYRGLGAGTGAGAKELWEEVDFGPAGAAKPEALRRLREHGEPGLAVASHTTLAPTMGSAMPPPEPIPGYALVEIYSAHGSSACRTCERSLFAPGAGDPDRPPGVPEGVSSVAEVLDAAGPLGIMAAGDSHDGRPGASGWGAWPGGLTGLFVDELTSDGLVDAMAARRTLATTGRRALVQLQVDGEPMGSIVEGAADHTLRVRALDTQPLAELRLIRDGQRLSTLVNPAEATWHTVADPAAIGARWYYVEALFADGELAWSSPVFTEDP